MGRVTEFLDDMCQFLDCNFHCIAEVKDAGRFRIEFGGPNNTIHKVGNVSETASLQSISMDFHRLVSENGRDKYGLRSPPPAQVLPWSVAAEETEYGDRHAVAGLISEGHVLIEQFGYCIRPARNGGWADHRIGIFTKWYIRIF